MRPTRDSTMLALAAVLSERSTCARRKVGCVFTDEYGRVIAGGHNGVARGQPHCTDTPCAGSQLPSGHGLELCQAIHAEQNALMFCSDVMKIDTCYVTAAPCVHCSKMLLNTSCRRIVYANEYPHSEHTRALWEASGRIWEQFESDGKEQV